MEAEADALGLDGSVTLEGFEPDPAVFLDADLVLAPSYPESFGRAVLEAMASGIPVVAARSAGLEEVVGPDGAVLVAPGDTDALGREAAAILGDAERYRSVAEAGRRRAAAYHAADGRSGHMQLLLHVARSNGRIGSSRRPGRR